jgi:hypothetical protein
MAVQDDPFALLGLPPRAELTDDEVRAAWRRIAAATHPDREDGGDPARFGAAAAAYVLLRTSFGRGEALADLADLAAGGQPGRPRRHARPAARRIGTHRLAGRPVTTRRLCSQRLSGYRMSERRISERRISGYRLSGRRMSPRQAGTRRMRAGAAGTAGAGGYPVTGYGVTGYGVTGYQPAGYRSGAGRVSVRATGRLGSLSQGRALGLPVTSAAAVAAATMAAVGVTPATIGLLAGALTVTGWALWRRGGWGQ